MFFLLKKCSSSQQGIKTFYKVQKENFINMKAVNSDGFVFQFQFQKWSIKLCVQIHSLT